MKHIHKITFRGSIDILAYNKVLRLLYNNNIPYTNRKRITFKNLIKRVNKEAIKG